MSDKLTLDDPKTLSLAEPEVIDHNIRFTDINWHYIVQFTLDLRNRDDIMYAIIDREFISIFGDMDSQIYFSECMDNAEPKDFLPTDIRGYIDWDNTKEMDIRTPGIYRFVFGVVTKGDKYWTSCGWEYDAWEEYDLINCYKYSEKEAECVLHEIEEEQ